MPAARAPGGGWLLHASSEQANGCVASLAFDAGASPCLRTLGVEDAKGSWTCHVAVAPGGLLAAANYGDDSIALLERTLDKRGKPTGARTRVCAPGWLFFLIRFVSDETARRLPCLSCASRRLLSLLP